MSIFLSLVFYLVVFIISTLFIYVGKSSKKKYLTLIGILVVILLGTLRYGIGADYSNYLISYQFYATGETFDLGYDNHSLNIEPLFQLMAQLSYTLTKSPLLFFGIPWSMTVILIFFGIKRLLPNIKNKDFSLVWLLSISLITPFAFDQMRQTLAIAIFFFSIPYIINRNNVKYAFIVVLASTVHLSSIFIMVMSYILGRWLLKKRRLGRVKKSLIRLYFFMSILVLALYIITSLSPNLMASANLPYIGEMLRLLHDNNAIKLGVDELVPLILSIVPLLIMTTSVKKYTDLSAITNLFLTVGAAISPLSLFISLGGRLSQYFILLIPISIYILVNLRHNQNPSRKHATLLVNPYTIISVVFLSVIAFTGWTRTIPYVSMFSSSEIITKKVEPAPFYSLLCDLEIKKDCNVEDNKIQKDNRLWRP